MGEGRVTVLTFSANKERRDKEEDGVRQTETRTCLCLSCVLLYCVVVYECVIITDKMNCSWEEICQVLAPVVRNGNL